MLTAQQMTDARRYCGYPLTGTTMAITDDQDIVYLRFGLQVMSLHKRLTNLSAAEEAVVVQYLTQLATLEAAIPAVGADLDTDQAAVWTRNKNQLGETAALYALWRRRLCGFIGVAPGPDLSGGRVLRG